MAGYIGKSQGVTQVDGYNRSEADAEFVDVTGDTMTGALTVDADGATVLTVDRATSDGTIIDLQKDGSSVGTIGNNGARIYIGSAATGLFFNNNAASIEPYNTSTASTRDAAIDLGSSDERFKDLYLSGGIYLGGTGAANYLDDYEEGTFTPTYVSSGGGESVTYDDQFGFYTKVGNRVFFNLSLGTDAVSGGSGDIRIDGLPFTVKGSVGAFGNVITLAYSFASTITGGSSALLAGTTTRMDLYKNDNNANVWSWSTLATGANSNRLSISGQYLTDA